MYVKLWSKIYPTYIRPHIEFANSAWNPYLQKDIKILEKVQRRATKVPNKLRKLPYESRCKEFNLTTHVDRRIRGVLIQFYKIINGIDDVNWHAAPKLRPPRRGHRGHYEMELVRNCGARLKFFNNRTVTKWNSLPDSVVFADSVNSFKNRLDDYSKHKSTTPSPI